MDNILIILGGTIIGCILIWFLWRQYLFYRTTKVTQKIIPVWAGQGPFDNGVESARAMEAAYIAVLGTEAATEAQESIKAHSAAYDQDPNSWENLREESLKVNQEIKDYITIAEGLVAMENINKGMLEDGGHRLEAITNENGGLDFAYKKIWPDEEIENHKKQTNDTILISLGESLLKSETPEGKELLVFLTDLYSSVHGKTPETAKDIGNIFFNCITTCDDETNNDICLEFNRLYNAYSPNDEEDQ